MKNSLADTLKLNDIPFLSAEQKKFLSTWLKMNDGISLNFVTRSEFDSKNGDYLVRTSEKTEKTPDTYILFLPEDLRFSELFSITKNLEIKLWHSKFVHFNDLKNEIKAAVAILLRDWNISAEQIKEMADELNIPEWLQSEFEKHKLKNTKKLRSALKGIKQNLDDLYDPDFVWDIMRDSIYNNFNWIFFDRWKSILSDYMAIFTKNDYDSKVSKRNWRKIKEDSINFHVTNENHMHKTENKLRNELMIDKIKKLFNILLQQNELDDLYKQQEVFCRKLLLELNDFPWIDTKSSNDPSHMLKEKEMTCVWTSILAHVFLEEVWIKHYWLTMEAHSALIVVIWWTEYYFDPTNWIFEDIMDLNPEMVWETLMIRWKKFDELNFLKGDADSVLRSQMLYNKWVQLFYDNKLEEALIFVSAALKLNWRCFQTLNLKAWILIEMNEFSEAFKFVNESLKVNPLHSASHWNKWILLAKIWNIEDALNYIQSKLKTNPKDGIYWETLVDIYKLVPWSKDKVDICEYVLRLFSFRKGRDIIKEFILTTFNPRKRKIFNCFLNFDHKWLLSIVWID